MEEKMQKFIWTERQDKIFIHAPTFKESRRIKISPKIEVYVWRKNAKAFAVKRTKIFQPRQTGEYFVFKNCDSGIVVACNTFEPWMVFLSFEEDGSLTINCDFAENAAKLRIPKQFSGMVKAAMYLNSGVKKLTPPRLSSVNKMYDNLFSNS